MNIALRLCYDGTAYHGWQSQKNAVTVCDTLTAAIEKTIGEKISLHGCGRTDTGVHAKTYVANFHSNCRVPLDRLPLAINGRLPGDILVKSARVVRDDFDAIGSCVKKEYTYLAVTERDPFWQNRAMLYEYPVNLEKMRTCAASFVGEKDFACVQSVGTEVKSTVRTLYYFDINQESNLLIFRICANGFLYNMARALVGSVLYGNEGKITDIPALIRSRDRRAAGPTVPACGLYMTNVWYGAGDEI